MRKITFCRRIIQIISFVLLVYGGVLLGLQIIEAPEGFRAEQRIAALGGPAYGEIFDTYLPVKSCRRLRETGAFEACFLHFLSKSITWLTPLKYFLPHLLLFIILCFLFGRFWCGWICPLGFILDVFSIIRREIKFAYVKLPRVFREGLIKFKYLFLSFIILISLAIAAPIARALGLTAFQKELFLVGCQMCPSRFIFPILSGNTPIYDFTSPILAIFSLIGLLFLLIFFLGFFVRRSFCKICPSGALISFFNLGGAMTKEKEVLKCTKCGICARACPMQNRKVYEEKKKETICDTDCIRCFKCVDMCPERDCLKVKLFGKTICRSKFK